MSATNPSHPPRRRSVVLPTVQDFLMRHPSMILYAVAAATTWVVILGAR